MGEIQRVRDARHRLEADEVGCVGWRIATPAAASTRARRARSRRRRIWIRGCDLAAKAGIRRMRRIDDRSEEHTSELQSPCNLVCRLLLEKKKKNRCIDGSKKDKSVTS